MIAQLRQFGKVKWMESISIPEIDEVLIERMEAKAHDLVMIGEMEVGYYDLEIARGTEVVDSEILVA